jgi:hypothetical protein
MEHNSAPDTLAELPHTDTLRPSGPPPLPIEVDESELLPVIPRGKARLALAGALLDMHRAIYALEATCSAIARQLDAQEGGQ